MRIGDAGNLTPWAAIVGQQTTERRQDAERTYRRDGTVYGFKRYMLSAKTCDPWYCQPCIPLMIPKSETCELDTPDDWAIAEVRLAAKEASVRA